MYRIAVIQNGIEMQHSGYVDGIPLYKKIHELGKEKIQFARFTGVNISALFVNGENFLLDFDACIIGTNATSDDDVYRVLLQDNVKSILSNFLEKGKGLLICSQKKLRIVNEVVEAKKFQLQVESDTQNIIDSINHNGSGDISVTLSSEGHNLVKSKRTTGFLPPRFEYSVQERPSEESSKDPGVKIVSEEECTLNQKCIIDLPNKITDELIEQHCQKNSFQTHYYRDFIIPKYESAYQSLFVDVKNSKIRNLLMVGVPQKKEKIVISTMALDWGQHIELLENIINYLIRGVPRVALVQKNNQANEEMKLLALEAEINKVGFCEYINENDLLKNVEWHSLIVFSKEYEENEVFTLWKKIKTVNRFIKIYHYRLKNDELVLCKYSNNSYVENQIMDVKSWLFSKRGINLWDNSFWKTFDVLRFLKNTDNYFYKYLNQVCNSILNNDDNGKNHYKKDYSYDGVLAPTCGMLELFYLNGSKKEFDLTKKYLLKKFKNLDDEHNKLFVIRTLCRCKCEEVKSMFEQMGNISLLNSLNDLIDLDICLCIEVLLNKAKIFECTSEIKNALINCFNSLIERKSLNGKWDNLGNTANIVLFLLEQLSMIQSTFSDNPRVLQYIQNSIEDGVYAIKSEYSIENFNWENNIVTTANSMNAICLFDKLAYYKSSDLLKIFSDQDSNYNALNISLEALEKSFERSNSLKNMLNNQEEISNIAKKNVKALERKLIVVSSFAGFGIFALISVLVWMAIKNFDAFLSVISELFMWIPVTIGIFVTPIITFIIRKLSSYKKNK